MEKNIWPIVLKQLKTVIPHPATELNYSSPFELLIAVMLSAHSTDTSVNKATTKLFTIASSPEKIIALGENQLKQHIKTIGLFNTKATNIIKTCQLLITKFNGQIPSTREELESLPGVGRKTANVILNIIFKQPVIAVDTHIFRVANRLILNFGKNPLEVEEQLYAQIPLNLRHDAHHLLLLHGRYTCTAKNPKCEKCVIQKYCSFYKNLTITSPS